jgi:hypothetical protein
MRQYAHNAGDYEWCAKFQTVDIPENLEGDGQGGKLKKRGGRFHVSALLLIQYQRWI